MSQDDRKIAESVRSGQYFREARAWYQAVYIGPISERSFFLLIAILAVITGVTSLLALASLLPLTTHPGIPVSAPSQGDEVVQSLVRLRDDEEPADEAMVHFFVTQYVRLRESYTLQTYQTNALFVRAQSSPEVYAAYSAAYSVTNPTSPAATLGSFGQRIVALKTITTSTGTDPGHAKVEFTTETVGTDDVIKSRWIAKLDYVYTGIKIDMVKNAETGKDEMQVTDPKFQVTRYELKQDD